MKVIGTKDYKFILVSIILFIFISIITFIMISASVYIISIIIIVFIGIFCSCLYPVIKYPEDIILYNENKCELTVYLSRKERVVFDIRKCENISLLPGNTLKDSYHISFTLTDKEIIAKYVADAKEVIDEILKLKKEANEYII